MADKNIQILNASGDYLYPRTKGAVVLNSNGETLEGVEAGAQVNLIEKVTVNGTELSIVDKTVNVTIDAAAEYSVEKLATASDGYASTYQLTKDGVAVGDLINIPKDLVVESGTVKTVAEADSPVAGYVVGDKYIDLVLANSDDEHIYILVSDLIDVYTAGTGVIVSGNTISIDVDFLDDTIADAIANKADKATTLEGYGITDAYTKTETDALLDEKADNATTLEGYGITDAYTKTEVDTLLSSYLTYVELA